MTKLEQLENWIDENFAGLEFCASSTIFMHELLQKITQLKAEEGEWISVDERLPTPLDADENEKVLIWRETNSDQKSLSKSLYDYKLVKYLIGEKAFWQPLPNPPKP